MKDRSLLNRLTLLTLLFLVIVSTAVVSASAPPNGTTKPKILTELLSTPANFVEERTARLVLTILPYNICQQDEVDGNGGGPATTSTPVYERTVVVLLAIRRLDGSIVAEIQQEVGIGGSLILERAFDPADFGDNPSGEIIATACVKDVYGKRKWPCNYAIVSASLQVIAVQDDNETDSLSPLLPVGCCGPIPIKF